MTLNRSLLFLLVALSAVFSISCQRGDPMQQPVTAGSVSEFTRWRARVTDRITADQWREFDLMIQEIKLRVTADKEATGSEAVEAAMRGRINGRSFQQVLAMGVEYKLKRLRADRVELAKTMELNAQLSTKPGDTASAAHLDTLRQRQQARLERLDAEIAGLEKRLTELGGSGGAPASAASK